MNIKWVRLDCMSIRLVGVHAYWVKSTIGSAYLLVNDREGDQFHINLASGTSTIRLLGPRAHGVGSCCMEVERMAVRLVGLRFGRYLLCGGGTHDSPTLGSLCGLGKSLRYGGGLHTNLTSWSSCLSGLITVIARGSPSR